MKKFLISLFLLIVSFNIMSYAYNKAAYYSDIFNGIKLDTTFYSETKEQSSSISLNNFKNVVLMSSQIVKFPDLLIKKNGISYVICDEPLSLKTSENISFNCDDKNVYAIDINSNIKQLTFYKDNTSDKSLSILEIKNDNKMIYVIPENYLISTIYGEALLDYFGALHKTTTIPSSSSDKKLDFYQYFPNAYVMETFGYFIALSLLFLILKPFLILLVNSPKKYLTIEPYLIFIKYIYGSLYKIRSLASKIFLFLIVLQIPLFVAWFNSSGLGLDISTINEYFNFSLNIKYLEFPTTVSTALSLGFFVLNYLFVVFGLLTFIPILVDNICSIFNNFDHKKVNGHTVVNMISFLILLSIFLITSFGIKNTYLFVFVFLLAILYLLTLIINLQIKLTREFVTWNLSLIILFIFFGGGIRIYLLSRVQPIKFREVISKDEKIALLPYKRDFEKNNKFLDYFIDKTNPIYADNYLIFHPLFSNIFNKPIKEFEGNEDNFIILNSSLNNFVINLLTNNKISKYLIENTKSNQSDTLFFDNFSYIPYSDYKVELIYKCTKDVMPFTYSLFVYKIDSFIQGGRPEKINFMHFSGCSAGEEKNLLLPLPIINTYGEKAVIKLSVRENDLKHSIDVSGIDTKINITLNGEKLNYVPININNINDTTIENFSSPNSNKVVVYSLDNRDKYFEVDNTLSKGEFNISEILNRMIDKKLIKNQVTIWSTNQKVIFKDIYLD